VPVYAYKGVTQTGRTAKGFVDAENQRLARAKLRKDGVFITDLSESSGARARGPRERSQGAAASRFSFSFASLRRIGALELALATRQLATLVGAGIPLVEALGALAEQVESSRLKGVIGAVRDRVNQGASLADALGESGVFGDLFVSMVRAGEASGALEQVLARLADYQEGQVRLQNRVMSIVLYPLMMLAFSVLVVALLVVVVLPQITQLLESLNRPLPLSTRIVIGLSEFVRTWWWALGLAAVAASVGLRAAIRTERGRARWDAFKLRVPVLGKVVRLLAISRFARTLSTLLAGGIPIVRAMGISKLVANNAVIGRAVEQAAESLTEGASLAGPLRASGEFPPLVIHMVDVGERSGELEPMLAKIAESYDEQVESSVTRLTALLEPLLILLMVGIVIMIILSVLLPMLELTGSIQ
jgi:general secretion pathway protein F